MQWLLRQLDVGRDPEEVRRARHWVRAQLEARPGGPDPEQVDTLVLLVSELVTNALVHTARPAVLRLAFAVPEAGRPDAAVRLEVADVSSRAPVRRSAGGEDTGGRGLELVELLADRWGWGYEGDGKRIWCELDCADRAAAGIRPETRESVSGR
ncbi:ATP-binding protein [Streptomyces aidingensis]|uniref:Anti-sigma regulatory factor (Ser/Thr protein kinase) n=1 Tax=Streptomyces aidingensis TaxID=910347 RepID=A0A1I1HA10_9ACTN|nr:ATP-binding protein [Streptomyces aidingensis]SFC20691.1 Anti-sigma regulatory factor (Ser/Thr protein kinase) [Streptomyces aidingensis]